METDLRRARLRGLVRQRCFAAASDALLRSSCAVSCFARDSSCRTMNHSGVCQPVVLCNQLISLAKREQ